MGASISVCIRKVFTLSIFKIDWENRTFEYYIKKY